MRILFLTDNYPPEPNAGASRVYERARYWVKWGHDVTVLTSVPNKPEGKVYKGFKNKWYQECDDGGIRVIRVKTFVAPNEGSVLRMLDFLSYLFTSFFFGLFLERPDVIAATSPQFFTAVSGWALAAAKRVPFIFEVADLWPETIVAVGAMKENWIIKFLERIELFLYRRSAKVILLSPAYGDSLTRRGIPADKQVVILNGVDFARFEPRPKDSELLARYRLQDRFVIGYIGTVSLAHSVHTAARAAEFLRDLPITILIVGSGSGLKEIESIVAEKNLSNVVCAGRRPKEEMPGFWSVLDVSLVHLQDLPILKTSIPSKIFEAMGCGKPILLGAPDGEAAKIVRETESGITVAPDSPRDLAAAMERLYRDRDLLDRLTQNSLRAAPKFSRETQARKVIEVFDAVG